MQPSHSVADCPSSREDDDAPCPLVVDVLDIVRDDLEESKTPENPKQDQAGIESGSSKMAYDELHEILSWLPAKAVIRCSSSLCKWLCKIQSESRFIQKQCIRSSGKAGGFFLQQKERKNDRVPNKFKFHLLPGETDSSFGIPRKSLDYIPKTGHILSSSNGLLLLGHPLLKGGYKLKVCNPATKEYAHLRIPKDFHVTINESLSPLIECYPYGDDFPNDYTVAVPRLFEMMWQEVNGFLEKTHKQQLYIFSDGKWDEELCNVTVEGRFVRYDMPVAIFANAAEGLIIHYLCDSGKFGRDPITLEPYIAAYNIREKKLSRKIKLPEEAWEKRAAKVPGRNLHIFKWGDTSICLVKWLLRSKDEIKVWLLDDYGSKEEAWRQVMDTNTTEKDLLLPESGRRPGDVIMSVGVASGGRGLLIATAPDVGSRLFLFVLEGADRGKLELLGNHGFSLEKAPSPAAASYSPYAMFGMQGMPSKDPGVVTFMPYVNTLRPVYVKNTKTSTY